MSRPAPERGPPRAARHQFPEEPTRALHGKVLGGIWAGTGKKTALLKEHPLARPVSRTAGSRRSRRKKAQGGGRKKGAPANPPGQDRQGHNELGGCLSPACAASPLEGLCPSRPRNVHLHQGDPWSERGSWRGWGAERLVAGDGGREANVLLGKTKKRRACRRLGDGHGSPEAKRRQACRLRGSKGARRRWGD